jgi:hypothetical protein
MDGAAAAVAGVAALRRPGPVHVIGWQGGPQVPFARHVWPDRHPPHCTVPVHALAIDPQATPWATHSSGTTGEHVLANAPAPHCWPVGHLPQSTSPPSPSDIWPHLPEQETVAVVPHVCATASHTCPLGQPPQLIDLPHTLSVPHPRPSAGQRVASSGLGQATHLFDA